MAAVRACAVLLAVALAARALTMLAAARVAVLPGWAVPFPVLCITGELRAAVVIAAAMVVIARDGRAAAP
jgi:hypothetical protein